MADEKKTYLINIESNLEKYANEAALAKKRVDEMKAANDALIESGKLSASEIQANESAIRNANKEYAQSKKLLDLQTTANNSNKESRKQLNAIYEIEKTRLGNLANSYTINANGQRVLSQEYLTAKKNVTEAKAAIIAYDQAQNDGRTNVGRYGESVQEAMKGVGIGMLSAVGPVALVTGALNKLKEAFFDTEMGAKFTKVWQEGIKGYFQTLIGGGGMIQAGMNAGGAAMVGKLMDDIRKGDRQDLIDIAKMEGEIKDLRLQSVSASLSLTEQKEFLLKAEAKEAELIAFKIKDKEEELNAVKMMLVFRSEDTALLDREAQLEAEIITIKSDKSLRIATKLNALKEKEIADLQKNKDLTIKTEKEKSDAIIKEDQRVSDAYLQILEEERKALNEQLANDAKELLDRELKRKEYDDNRFLIDAKNKRELLESSITSESELKFQQLENDRKAELLAAEQTGADVFIIEQKYANYKLALQKEVERSKYQVVADFAGNIADLFEKQSVASKVAAVAQATINTYLGATAAFAQTPGGIIIKSIAAAGAVVTGLMNVKKILEVNPKGSNSAPTAISSTPAAQRAFAPQVQSTVLTQTQLNQSQLNALPQNNLADVFKNMPPTIVTVEDINAKTNQLNKVQVRATI